MDAVLESPLKLLAAIGYALPRLFAMFSMIPMLTQQALPGTLRTGFVGAIALLLVPGLVDPAQQVEGAAAIVVILIKEVLLGMVIGLVMAIPLWAFEAMGAFVDNQRGASIAQIINPLTGHDSSPLGELFSQAAMTYLLASGGMLILLKVAYSSYELWPVFARLPRIDGDAAAVLLGQFDRLTRLAVLIGAPVLIAMFLAEMGLALISRFAPQMQVFFLAMGIKSAVAMFVLAVYAVTLFVYFGSEVLNLELALQTVKKLFSGGPP
ncbi:MAG: EscT/YscT/HrcT family type III secretion system export apparatus protein [Comamonadaceae bacterium]|nr:MAG: EscT/YscT/HrcT family type III secretion system export apparatus protein [Comamonadaceae bacterium]